MESSNFDDLFTKLSSPMEKEDAIALAESKWWEKTGMAKAAFLQLNQSKLCMPFDKFHESVEFLLGRPTFTHEFAQPDRLIDEALTGNSPALEEILDLIPAEKRLIIETKDS